MAYKIQKWPCKVYSYTFEGPSSFIPSRSTSLLGDLNKLFDAPVLSGYSILAPKTLFAAPFIVKYTEKDLQCIVKSVLEV